MSTATNWPSPSRVNVRRTPFTGFPAYDRAPEGVKHYRDITKVPFDINKYYNQRFSLFSRYDSGVWLTHDAWFGVTPEPIANKIAREVSDRYHTPRSPSYPSSETVLIDAFAGVGGNTIAFARHTTFSRIIAIEKLHAELECAKHNAALYRVKGPRIEWRLGDAFEIVPRLLAELRRLGTTVVVFASPPWGGVGYSGEGVLDLDEMKPYGLQRLMTGLWRGGLKGGMVLYLPRNSDMRQVAEIGQARKGKGKVKDKVDVVHYCLEGASKAMCVYLQPEHLIMSAQAKKAAKEKRNVDVAQPTNSRTGQAKLGVVQTTKAVKLTAKKASKRRA